MQLTVCDYNKADYCISTSDKPWSEDRLKYTPISPQAYIIYTLDFVGQRIVNVFCTFCQFEVYGADRFFTAVWRCSPLCVCLSLTLTVYNLPT